MLNLILKHLSFYWIEETWILIEDHRGQITVYNKVDGKSLLSQIGINCEDLSFKSNSHHQIGSFENVKKKENG